MKVLYKILFVIVVVVLLSGCSDENTFGADYNYLSKDMPAHIMLDKNSVELAMGCDIVLTASLTPGTSEGVLWSSSDVNIAKVDNQGKVTAHNLGSATIWATSKQDMTQKASCKVNVATVSIELNQQFLQMDKGDGVTLSATVSPSCASEKGVKWSSSDASVVSVDNNGKVKGVNYGSATVTVTSVLDNSKKATCAVKVIKIENGHEYVDLGLTSGTLWAKCNVGASSPSDYGNYYAWGETTTKSEYTESNYTSNPTTLPLDKDAARANWGGNWRMPTTGEFTELNNECIWTWTTMSRKEGYKVTSKKNGNIIFLPAAGYYYDSLNSAGSLGCYWSSSLYSSNTSYAYLLDFYSSNIDPSFYGIRYYGMSVRPVLKK